jgi:hypothetical protein
MPILEGAVALGLVLLAAGMNIELVRRAQYEVILRHSCFLYVRERALGAGIARSREKILSFIENALGSRRARALLAGLDWTERSVPDGLEAKVQYRYPSLIRFPYDFVKKNGERLAFHKHHFILTEKCLFFF